MKLRFKKLEENYGIKPIQYLRVLCGSPSDYTYQLNQLSLESYILHINRYKF